MKKELLLLVFFLNVLLCFVSAQVPIDSLKLYYTFSDSAYDFSGNNRNGIVYGAELTTDRFGDSNAAYNFNKAEYDYIDIPAKGLNLDQYTYSLWVSLNLLPDLDGRYVAFSIGSTGGDQGFSYANNFVSGLNTFNGWGYYGYNDSSAVNSFCIGDTASLNQWYHIAVTRSTNVSRLYINGVLQDTTIQIHRPSYGSDSLIARIGGRFNNSLPADAKIDDVRIYSRALSKNEINSLYFEGSCVHFVTVYKKVIDTITVHKYVNDTITVYKSVTDTLIITDMISGTEPNTENTIKIYPNPASDHINIDYGNFESMKGYTLKIINSLGQVQFEEEVHQQNATVDIKSWNGDGLYFVQIINPSDNIVDIRKIIIRRIVK